jgi:hypothetical protein
MERNEHAENDKKYNDIPVTLVKLIKASLDTKNVSKKLTARRSIVRMGKTVLPQLNKLLKSEDIKIRHEAAKIIELIANRTSIPVLINLLEDIDFDIRWIAAEGLIKIGRRSIRPLLKSVRDGKNSIFLNEGAHHVLVSLLNENEKRNEKSLLLSLENYHTLGLTAPVEASIALGPAINWNNRI